MKELSDLPEKEFRVMIMKMLSELKRRMDKHNENLNKGENRKKTRS